MINNRYAKAYTEVLEIVKHFPKEEYNKIPAEKIEFYKENMDKNYIFLINPELELEKQNISPEANAIIVNLYFNYFATEEQKNKMEKILDLNQKREEQEKIEKYNPDNIFKKKNKIEISQEINIKNENAMVEYKEPFFVKFKNFILKILHLQ